MDNIWSEIESSSQEIFDLNIPELRELNEEEPTEEESWKAFLNSKWDF